MPRRIPLFPSLLLLLLPTAVYADGPTWGKSASEDGSRARTYISGMKAYYEANAVDNSDGVAKFKIYKSATASAQDPGTDYALNCETREVTSRSGEGATAAWKAPVKVLDGEAMYHLGRQLCDWDKPGFFKRLMN